jgi:opacity protein-like surface antigen
VSRQFTVGAEFAYNSFGEMKDDGVTSSATTTPILLRARAFLSPEGKFRPYLTGGIGFSDVSFDWDDGDESIGGSSSVFAFSLGVGAEAKVSENLFWDFRLTFNSAQTDGQNFDFDEFEVEPQFNSTYIGFTVGIKAGL